MKKLLPTLALTTIPLAALPVVLAQEQTQEDAPTAEQRIAVLEAKVETLLQSQKAHDQQVDELIAYLGKRSQAAGALLAELDSCESLGFTAGINPQSRQVLLSGFRSYYGEEQRDVPTKPAAKEAPKESPAKRAVPKSGASAKRP